MASPTPSSPPSSTASSPDVHRETAVEAPSISRLKALLRENLRITISDGRIFVGTLAGTDKPLNVILINTEEFRIGPGEDRNGRYVGQIVVPWKLVVKIEAAGSGPGGDDPSRLYT